MDKILSAGTVVELSNEAATDIATDIGTATFTDITCALTGISTEVAEREQIETTALCETDTKTYVDGLKDQDTASSDAFFNPSSEEGIALKDAADSKETRILRVTFTDGSSEARLVRVQPFGYNSTVGDVVKTTINFKFSGTPVFTAAP